MAYLYLIRHGKANSTGENYDQLSETGHRQAELFANFVLQSAKPDRIFSGTMRRQVETASYLAKLSGITPESTPGLNEFNHQFWQAQAKSIALTDVPFKKDLDNYAKVRFTGGARSLALFLKLTERVLNEWYRGKTPDGFESYAEFEGRVLGFLTEISKPLKRNESVFVFSSGTPISLMIAKILGWPPERGFDWMRWIFNTSVTLFRNDSGIKPIYINALPHLPERKMHTLV